MPNVTGRTQTWESECPMDSPDPASNCRGRPAGGEQTVPDFFTFCMPPVPSAAAAAAKSLQSDSVRPTRLHRPWDSPGKNTGVSCHFLLQCMKVKSESEVTQSCLTLRDPMDCSPPGSSVHEIFQARVLEWVAIAFSAFKSKLGLI